MNLFLGVAVSLAQMATVASIDAPVPDAGTHSSQPTDRQQVEAEVYYKEGVRLMAGGDYDDAIEVFERVIASYPETEYARAAREKRREAMALRESRVRSRRGFFLGFGIGGGHAVSNELEEDGFDRTGLALDIRVGGGLSERLLLMGEVIGLAARQDFGGQLNTYHTVIALQAFLVHGLFVRAGPGMAFAILDTPFGDSRSNTGFAFIGVLGYELRLGEMFALSMEGGAHYANTDDYTSVTPEGHVGFTWYW